MNYLSLFSGIGAFESALRNMEIPFNLVGFSEIDKYATKSYCAIHNVSESLNLGDITKIDETKLPKVDLVTYGFPCQDISLAGRQKGLFNEDGTKTRSGLFFDALRIIEATKPMVAIAENVKNLTSKKFTEQFKIVLKSLEDVGYNNYWKVLNAKDYGIPQNRERVFIISIRKDVDTGCFEFPEGYPLKLRLKDLLEEVVDEKFYLKDTQSFFIKNSFDMEARGNGFRFEPHVHKNANVAKTITTRAGARMDDNFVLDGDFDTPTFKFDSRNPLTVKVMQIGNCRPTKTRANPNQGRIYDTEGLAPCLNQMGGGNREPHIVDKVIVREATKKGFAEAYEGDSINLEQPNSTTRRGRVGHGVAQTLTTSPQQGVVLNSPWISEKGVKYITSPKRGMCTDINADVIQPLTATGQSNWTGSFVSPDIERLEKNSTIGGKEPTKIVLKNGQIITSDDDTSHLRIRKLTPKECFRLMGFKDEEFAKAEAVNSNTQLYKQAGNSIVISVIEHLIKALFDCGVYTKDEQFEI